MALSFNGLFAPGLARAECGGHATSRSMGMAALADPEFWLLLNGRERARPGPLGPQAPCSGPMCSRGPLAPLAPPVTSLASSDQWGCLGDPPPPTGPNPFTTLPGDGPVRPIHAGSGIERPPRP